VAEAFLNVPRGVGAAGRRGVIAGRQGRRDRGDDLELLSQ
jgi:hypothetical protein